MKYAKLIDGYIAQIVESEIEQVDFVPVDFEISDCPGPEYRFNFSKRKWEEFESELKKTLIQQKVLTQRQELLLSSDWTQLPDVPTETRQKWINYRQKLRDMTSQSGYPFNVVWPTPPQG